VSRQPAESGHPRVFAPENMMEPRPIFNEVLTPQERRGREEMRGSLTFTSTASLRGTAA
jgi:hypothetical protein